MTTRRGRPAVVLLFVLAMMLLASACSHTKNDTLSATQGLPDVLSNVTANTWLLDRTSSHPPLETRAVITLDFSEDRTFGGTAACHNYRGTFKVKGSTLTIESLDSTDRGCTAAVAAADNKYFLSLRAVHRVAPTDRDHLRLTGNGGLRLVFDARSARKP
jgi:heat shock protein HslJ